MNSEQCGKKRSWPKWRCHPGISVGAFSKTVEYLHRRVQANIQIQQFPDIKALLLVAVFGAISIKRGLKLVQPPLCSLLIKHWAALTSIGRTKWPYNPRVCNPRTARSATAGADNLGFSTLDRWSPVKGVFHILTCKYYDANHLH
jgi:hypothetical protein